MSLQRLFQTQKYETLYYTLTTLFIPYAPFHSRGNDRTSNTIKARRSQYPITWQFAALTSHYPPIDIRQTIVEVCRNVEGLLKKILLGVRCRLAYALLGIVEPLGIPRSELTLSTPEKHVRFVKARAMGCLELHYADSSSHMTNSDEARVNKKVAEQAIRHIKHYGGGYASWYVGVDDTGSDRDDGNHKHPVRYEMNSHDEAIRTMSWLLEAGLQVDDEYGAEPTILFIYAKK